MNADYRAGMLAALTTLLHQIGTVYGNRKASATDWEHGYLTAAREIEIMTGALRSAAQDWGNETEKETEKETNEK